MYIVGCRSGFYYIQFELSFICLLNNINSATYIIRLVYCLLVFYCLKKINFQTFIIVLIKTSDTYACNNSVVPSAKGSASA